MPERTVLCLDTLFVQGDDKKRYKNGEKEKTSFLCLNLYYLNKLNKIVFFSLKMPAPPPFSRSNSRLCANVKLLL